MYNRYIPQPDGSYRRSQMPDSEQGAQRQGPGPMPQRPSGPKPEPPPESKPPAFGQNRQSSPNPRQQRQSRPAPPRSKRPAPPERKDFGIGTFLRQLLPRDFDAEDLLIVLMLLLMSGDCAEDQNFALLTLALYLFM